MRQLLAFFILLADHYLALPSVRLLADGLHNYTHYEDENVEGPTLSHN